MTYYYFVGILLLLGVLSPSSGGGGGSSSILQSVVPNNQLQQRGMHLYKKKPRTNWEYGRADGREGDWWKKRARMYFEDNKPEESDGGKGGGAQQSGGREPTTSSSLTPQQVYVIDPVFGWNSGGWNGGWNELGLFVRKTTCGWSGTGTVTATLGLQPSLTVEATTVTSTSTITSTAPPPTLTIAAPTQYITVGISTSSTTVTLPFNVDDAPTSTVTSITSVPLYTSTEVIQLLTTSYLCTSTTTSYSATVTVPSATEFSTTCAQEDCNQTPPPKSLICRKSCSISTSFSTVFLSQTSLLPAVTSTQTISGVVASTRHDTTYYPASSVTLFKTHTLIVKKQVQEISTSTAAAVATTVETITMSLPLTPGGSSTQLTTTWNACTITNTKVVKFTSTIVPTENTVTITTTPQVVTMPTVTETATVLLTIPMATLTTWVTNTSPASFVSTQTLTVEMPQTVSTVITGDTLTLYQGTTTLQYVSTVLESVTVHVVPTALVTETVTGVVSVVINVQTSVVYEAPTEVPLEIIVTQTSVTTIIPTLTATATQLKLVAGCTWDGGAGGWAQPQPEKAPVATVWEEVGSDDNDASPGQLIIEPSIGLPDDDFADERFTTILSLSSSSGSGWYSRTRTPALASSSTIL